MFGQSSSKIAKMRYAAPFMSKFLLFHNFEIYFQTHLIIRIP